MYSLPSLPGTYALHLSLKESRMLDVGSLGSCRFPAGHYIYLGSACGPGGLRSRLTRHIAGTGVRYWHIDFLRAIAQPTGIHYFVHPPQWESPQLSPLECRWCQALTTLHQAYIPVRGFGAGDCRFNCPAHLVVFGASADVDFADVFAHTLEDVGAEIYHLRLNKLHHSTITAPNEVK